MKASLVYSNPYLFALRYWIKLKTYVKIVRLTFKKETKTFLLISYNDGLISWINFSMIAHCLSLVNLAFNKT